MKKKYLKIFISRAREVLIFFFNYSLLMVPIEWEWKKKGKKAILLVHGYLNNSSVWLYFGNNLKKLDFGSIYTINLKNPFKSIEEYAKRLKEKIDAISEEGIEEIDLIAHSMGGLVSLYFATNLKSKVKIKKIICLGTPFDGTKTAFYGFGKCANQMRYLSFFTKKLKENILKEKKIKIYSIATKLDQIIIPYTSSILEKRDNLILEDLGHASLLFSKKVMKKVIFWLKN